MIGIETRVIMRGDTAVPRAEPLLRTARTVVVAVAILLGSAGTATPGLTTQPSAEVDLTPAERALGHGDLDEADRLARRQGERNDSALTVRALVALARGQLDDTRRWLEQAVSQNRVGDGALELGLFELARGDGDRGRTLLEPIAAISQRGADARMLTRAARASWALGRFRRANQYFRDAAAAAPRDPRIQTAWGELFLEKHNRQEASQSFQAALGADNAWVPAHVGLARTLADENPGAARAGAARALELDEDAEGAHLLLAAMDIDEGSREDAAERIAGVLERNPASLEGKSLRAAMAFLEDRTADFEREVSEVLAANPGYGEIYRVAGQHVARAYRFDEATALTRRAVELDPESSRAHAELGMHLLRTGDEATARQELDLAFRLDPYDVVTYNLLSLMDTLDGFEVSEHDPFIIKLHTNEASILEGYVVDVAREAFGELTARYGFTPEGPILIEAFPRHDDFAVRTLGLPGMLGALGACFGRVVTLDSPHARPPGSFNWQATLWHELAHVFTLQLSEQRVPRWLTEGVSVYEERRARPTWGREGTLDFVRAMHEDEVLPLSELNTAFSRADQIARAYHHSSLLVEHIIERFGEPALLAMLPAYGRGATDEDVLADVLQTDFANLQQSFDVFLDERFGDLADAFGRPEELPSIDGDAPPEELVAIADRFATSFPVQASVGHALYQGNHGEAARRVLERAVTLVPSVTGDESPRALLAEIAVRAGQPQVALEQLEALLGHGATDLEAARRLYELAREANDEARLRVAAQRIVELDPFNAEPHAVLGRLAFAAGDRETAVREFLTALQAGPVDEAAAHTDLAEVYVAGGEFDEAKSQAIAALEIAPRYERAQDLLLQIVDRAP